MSTYFFQIIDDIIENHWSLATRYYPSLLVRSSITEKRLEKVAIKMDLTSLQCP